MSHTLATLFYKLHAFDSQRGSFALPQNVIPTPVVLRPNDGHDLLILEVSRSHTTHHCQLDSSGLVISPKQRPLPDNTQQSQHAIPCPPSGIRTHNPRRRAATCPRVRRCCHWDRSPCELLQIVLL